MEKLLEKIIDFLGGYKLALTFDDVLLQPRLSTVLPIETVLTTKFSRNIELKIPVCSAAMDTVSEVAMCVALAQEGGIGVIHKNMSIEEQAEMVRAVKAKQGAMIQPICLNLRSTLGDYIKLKNEKGFGSYPVLDDEQKVVGVVTGGDVGMKKDKTILIKDIMTKDPLTINLNQIVRDGSVDINKAAEVFEPTKRRKLIVVNEDNTLAGMITTTDVEGLLNKPFCVDSEGRLRVAAAVGPGRDAMERVFALAEAGVDAIVIDSAHGHSAGVINLLKACKKKDELASIDFVAGNIATGEAATALINAGADAIKVGIGPGSICTTRIVAGVGVPQFTAIQDVVKNVINTVPVIADGGIKNSGDVVKALAAGASCIMAGSLFAGTDESPGEESKDAQGRKYKKYRGMGSLEAMGKGSADRYGQDDYEPSKRTAEGVSAKVPYKGPLSKVLDDILGGLQSGMGYCGAKTISELWSYARFVRQTSNGLRESRPHDIIMPND